MAMYPAPPLDGFYRDLADAGAMLGHPVRHRILALLLRTPAASRARLRAEAGPGALAHLRVLEALGVVAPTGAEGGRDRPYRLDVERYRSLARALGAVVDSSAVAA